MPETNVQVQPLKPDTIDNRKALQEPGAFDTQDDTAVPGGTVVIDWDADRRSRIAIDHTRSLSSSWRASRHKIRRAGARPRGHGFQAFMVIALHEAPRPLADDSGRPGRGPIVRAADEGEKPKSWVAARDMAMLPSITLLSLYGTLPFGISRCERFAAMEVSPCVCAIPPAPRTADDQVSEEPSWRVSRLR
jgi:hypothetical protein